MPRAVRNFWVQGYTNNNRSGDKPIKATGPTGPYGEMKIEVLMRENGVISDTKLVIQCREHNGKLTVTASFTGKPESIEHSTES